MWMVQMNNNGPVANGLAELNHDTQDEVKEIRDGVTGEGQGLSEEDESQINGDTENEDMNDGRVEGVQPKAHDQAVMQRPQQQPQGPLVRWDRFLPLHSLKVLLVENDDSTRHVVSALLRNCGYEVVAVANGLQAWKFLEDLTNHIDLILAEVVMPFLSGIGLLSKIMSHKTCKNIPVILMSSHDSMNIVFKCLSKGAVDFLVKPIRKNELKNLWQHVWRKCHSSSGSGSESGIRTQKFTQSKSAEESGNQTGSNNEDDIGSIGLHVRNGSDNGSGTQSSWTERAVEVDSPKPMSPWGQLADPPDSTCAQVIYSRTEAVTDNWVPMTTTKECERQDEKYENDVMGKDLQIGMPRIPNIQPEDPSEKVNIARNNEENFPERNLKKDGEQIDNRLELNSKKLSEELRNLGEVIHVITTSTDPQIETAIRNIPNNHSKIPNTKDKVIHEKKEMPSLELSLKRHRDIGDTRNAHDRNVLRHSDISAFSRYNSASTANLAPSRNVGSCSPLDNSSEAAKTESMQNYQSNSNSTPPNQRSNGSSNNIDMSSTTDDIVTKQAVQHNEPAPKSTLKCLQPSVAVQPVQNGHISVPQSMAQSKTDTAITDTILTQARGKNQQVQVQHHHHHYHHYHHHVHNMSQQQQQQQQQQQHDELSLKKMVAAAPQRGSSNMLGTSNVGNYSGNGNGSGSDQGSNGQNGSNTALISRGSNMESNDEITEKSGISGGIGFGSRIGVDQNRFAQREAALNKFRQKRKERCFEKKVRYQSRKKLAEQRPRIRGQFVRQVAQGNKEKDVRS